MASSKSHRSAITAQTTSSAMKQPKNTTQETAAHRFTAEERNTLAKDLIAAAKDVRKGRTASWEEVKKQNGLN